MKKVTDFNIMEFVKTEKELNALLDAQVEPYEEALSKALIYLTILSDYYKTEKRYYSFFSGKRIGKDMSQMALLGLKSSLAILKKEGIKAPIGRKKK